MNRKEEYQALLNELEHTPADLNYTMTRVQARIRKKQAGRTLRLWGIPVASIGGLLMAFVLMVNFSLPVAMACLNVPVLKELMEAVAFSESLKTMIENDFVQPVNQTRSADGAEMTVHYLVYDGMEMHIFYTASYNGSTEIEISPDYTHPDGSDLGTLSWSDGLPPSDGEMGHMSLGIHGGAQFPSRVKMKAEIYPRRDYFSDVNEPIPAPEPYDEWRNPDETNRRREPVAVLEFDLTLDERFIKAKRVYEPHVEVDLEGRILTVETVTVYPTGTQLVIRQREDNDAVLSSLDMWLESGKGKRIEQGSSGGLISAGGAEKGTTNYFLKSVYFEPDDELTLCIAEAKWREKGRERRTLDLVHYEDSDLPAGVALAEVKRNGDDIRLTFHTQTEGGNFASGWYDESNELRYFNSWGSHTLSEVDHNTGPFEHFTYLWNFGGGDTVDIELYWTEIVTYDDPIRVPLA